MENNICFSVLVDSVGNRAHQRVSPITASKSRHQRLCKSVSYLSFRWAYWPKAAMTSKLSLELATREEALVWTEKVLFAFTNVVAVSWNLLTFYAVYRNHRLRTISNMFVIALAVSDILMCTCCMPFTVVALFHGWWISGESSCLFQGFAVLTFGIVPMVSNVQCVCTRLKATWLTLLQSNVFTSQHP